MNRTTINTGRVILATGLLAGSLDIIAASVQYFIKTGKGPEPIFRFIASGLFGGRAFTDGPLMIVSGFVLHFVIATIFAAIFILIYRKWRFLSSNPIAWGLLYGMVIWAVMNLVVLPLSRAPLLKADTTSIVIAVLILMLMVGLPIALMARYYYGADPVKNV